MSELIQKHDNRATIRWKLLTGASALALTAYVSSSGIARAEDASQPQIWIELGGQLSRLDDGQETFAPAFPVPRLSIFSPSQKFEYLPRFSIDETGKISFQPEGSDWVVSASIQYGRSSTNRDVRQGTYPNPAYGTKSGVRITGASPAFPKASRFADTNAQTSENHFILDFQAGKDVGLGMFGNHRGSSVLSLGVRFAQFSARSNVAIKSDPDWHFGYKYFSNGVKFPLFQTYHTNRANLQAARSFHGIGPSLSWSASAPITGNSQDGEIAIDWSVNAALLFGRQRAKVHHQASAQYHGRKYNTGSRVVVYHPTPVNLTRSKSVTVPNVGGFAGLSFRYSDAKISLGYRGDFFFGAMDGGIDTRKSENRGFFGPFASISIGLGD
ncbi:MAG TPA: hypothetical protein VGT78_01360 [Rhizomicrobium sp.]|nr:hypothetical protein [Rhizomicrobium sp.]